MTKPSPIALVVCDNIYSESGGKTALVGLFNRITTQEFPAKHSRLCVYASVTDIRPNVKFKLDVVHSETDEMVVSLEGEPPKNVTPIAVFDFTFDLRNLVFKQPGLYFIRLWGNEHILLQRPFQVIRAPDKKQPDS
jgi:hypothetical protein